MPKLPNLWEAAFICSLEHLDVYLESPSKTRLLFGDGMCSWGNIR